MLYWPGRRGLQQTSCSEWWILLPASSATLGSSMAVCRGYCITSSTARRHWVQFKLTMLMYWCLHGTAPLYLMNSCTPTARPTLLVVNIFGLPVSRNWSFRAIVWTVLVVGVLLLRVRRPGICCQTVFFAIQHWVSTFLGVSWRHTFLWNIDKIILSAFEIFWECTT